MGPERAAKLFRSENPTADAFKVILYGSLSKTGVGHGTDRVIRETFEPIPTEIVFSETSPDDLKHPNTMDFYAYKDKTQLAYIRVESVGGGDIVIEGRPSKTADEIYPENSFAEIAQFCRWRYISLGEYVEVNEGPEIWNFLKVIWKAMRNEVQEGLNATGVLPGGLNVQRKARQLFEEEHAAHPGNRNRSPFPGRKT